LGSGKYFDIGDIFLERAGIDDWLSSVSQVIESLPDHVPVMLLGGDHTFSLPAILSARKRVGAPLSVIHFDSHLDLQVWASTYAQSSGQSFLLDPPVHSNFMSHVLTGAPDTKLYQMGVRNYQTIPSASAGAMREYLQRSSKIFTDQDFHHSDPLEFLSSIPLGSPVYVSMDIDCLSAPFAPATGHPSALGMIPRDLMRSLNFIRKHFRVVGADLMEVSKSADRGGELRTAELGMTALLALVGSP
jgi:arginase family enzyme